jgi:hypothetical protein
MAKEDTALNQDLNSTKTAFSPAHQHLEPVPDDAITHTRSPAEQMDRLGMVSARRAQNRTHQNDQKIAASTIFSK